jgi:hypothetical protein
MIIIGLIGLLVLNGLLSGGWAWVIMWKSVRWLEEQVIVCEEPEEVDDWVETLVCQEVSDSEAEVFVRWNLRFGYCQIN